MTAAAPARSLPAHAAVLGAGLLFGTSFVVMKDSVSEADPLAFLAVRFAIGTAVLAPFALRRRAEPQPGLVRGGVIAGVVLMAGYIFQTVGLQYTTSSVSAFITYLLVVFVPVLAAAWLRRLPAPATAAGVVLATVGLVLLTGGVTQLGKGELLTLGCAIAFAVHIVVLADLSPRFDTTRLNLVQLAVVAAGCAVPGALGGGFALTARAWAGALYTGVAVTAAAFALQVWGQRRVGPTHTSLLLMVEPVAAAALGYAVGDRLTVAGWIGCVLILIGIVTSEVGPSLRPRPVAEPA